MHKSVKTIVIVVGLAVAYMFIGPMMFTSCGNVGDYALQRLRACPAAVELLGDDIDTTFGLSWGSTESQGNMERAAVRLPVAGSKASGAYHYAADRIGNDIRFSGTLEVGDAVVDVAKCTGGAMADAEAAHTGSGSFDGKVSRSTHPNVAVGGTCNGTFTLRGTKKPAELLVKCDGVEVYRGEARAQNDVNDPDNPDDDTLTLTDDKTSDVDETPSLKLNAREGKADGESGTITVTDVEHGNIPAFEVEIAL
jgi:hypothetical protein